MSDTKLDLHVKPSFGLPYAPAEFDADGRYHVLCPVCGERCYPKGYVVGESPVTVAAEDIPKDANASYAEHFETFARADALAVATVAAVTL